MTTNTSRTEHWRRKFSLAWRGIKRGVYGQSSFQVHLPLSIAVIALAAILQLPRVDWCLLLLCMAVVLSAELFNSALECLAQAVTREQNPQIADALDIAAGAVLVTAIGASIVGLCVLLPALFPT